MLYTSSVDGVAAAAAVNDTNYTIEMNETHWTMTEDADKIADALLKW